MTDKTTSKKSTSRKAIAAGLTAGLLGGAAAGMVFGIPGVTSAESPAAVVQQVDDDSDTATTDRAAERGEKLRDVLQPLVDDNTINGSQADAVTDHLIENRPERDGRLGKMGGHHRRGPGGPGGGGEVIAETLGIEVEDLREQFSDGGTLADLAVANGVEVQTLIDAIVAEAQVHLDEAVADGKISAEDAAEKSADLTERITEMVNSERPERGERPHFGDDGDAEG